MGCTAGEPGRRPRRAAAREQAEPVKPRNAIVSSRMSYKIRANVGAIAPIRTLDGIDRMRPRGNARALQVVCSGSRRKRAREKPVHLSRRVEAAATRKATIARENNAKERGRGIDFLPPRELLSKS